MADGDDGEMAAAGLGRGSVSGVVGARHAWHGLAEGEAGVVEGAAAEDAVLDLVVADSAVGVADDCGIG